ncbi:uncharacterized protein LOC120015145 [Tripterygium wilfordii]|uniref:uncharacterized protein LOC120015145 n=1 Tax=Tripterygium wilfordii TaxID=458696 RepID=UPI0018F80E8B|nr:uncharacterized protein LOC120015145 [Tripterygium wilfordii]
MAKKMMAQQPLDPWHVDCILSQKLSPTLNGNKDSSYPLRTRLKVLRKSLLPDDCAALRSAKRFKETENAANATLSKSVDEFIPTKDKIPPNDESECHSFTQHSAQSETMTETKGFDHGDPPPTQVPEAAVPPVTPKINLSDGKSKEGMIAPKQEEQEFHSDDSALVPVLCYRVKEASVPVLRSVLKKHGDIAANSHMKSVEIRSLLLGQVCEIVRKLQTKKYIYLVQFELEQMLAVVHDLKSANLEIGWLHKRLEEILEAKQQAQRLPTLRKAMTKSTQLVQVKKTKLAVYKTELLAIEERLKLTKEKISLTENELSAAQADAKKDNETLLDVQKKTGYFLEHPLVDGLL